MKPNDSNLRPSVRPNSDNLTNITAKHRAAFGRLQDVCQQIEELKSVTWMLDETSTRLADWSKVVSSVSLVHRQVQELSCAIDRIHDDLDGLFSSRTNGGAA